MKIAIVVQRYGERVVGGAERHARLLAERFAGRHEVTVLTTCALDYRTWANELGEGEEVLNAVRVIRWKVQRKRKWRYFGWKSKRLFSAHSILDEYQWIVAQGPECPGLIEHLRRHRADFDVFIFFTYLYYPTVFGLPAVADKAMLVPTAHDEPAIRLGVFSTVFHLPRFIAFNTDEERDLVHGFFHNENIPSDVIGVGIDLAPVSTADGGYLLYAGRVEKGKQCDELFDLVRRANVPLKIIGHTQIPIPRHVEYLGFVSESEKQRLVAGCRAVVVPSRNESLSLVVLEAWAHGKPVIVSAQSPVLKAHVQKSGGGYVYTDPNNFREIVMAVDPARGGAGRRYVEEHYSWDVVLNKYKKAFLLAADCADSIR